MLAIIVICFLSPLITRATTKTLNKLFPVAFSL